MIKKCQRSCSFLFFLRLDTERRATGSLLEACLALFFGK